VYAAILAHKHTLEAQSGRLFSIREVVADALQRWDRSAAQPPASQDEDDPGTSTSAFETDVPAAPAPPPSRDLQYVTVQAPVQRLDGDARLAQRRHGRPDQALRSRLPGLSV
jgi:hypothetical protein